MLIEKIQSQLCHDLLTQVDVAEGLAVAITSFMYPNGDSVNLYFEDHGDEFVVTDEGATVDFLRSQHVDMTFERKQLIRVMCGTDVEFQSPRLVKRFDPVVAGPACMEFCETVTKVASIFYHSAGLSRSPLPMVVDDLLRKRVAPVRHIDRGWTYKQFDRKGSFPVDFRVNGLGPPRNIFSVTSASKSLLVTAVVHFLRSHGLDVPTMTIVDPDAKLSPRYIDRLQLASTEIKFGVEKHHADIVSFALGEDTGDKTGQGITPPANH
jgi:hypothetical protein